MSLHGGLKHPGNLLVGTDEHCLRILKGVEVGKSEGDGTYKGDHALAFDSCIIPPLTVTILL